ncbi:RNA ligase family protein [Cytophagaceae bacterium DM2B3-1]|uniref:RNA ligase family protein n=1 Tax=Xanthocytophaga flava TaxID=3048013 RepID=A0ABT7CWD5_9BACT|nr:RNA ligase family protein [Xanthocytophaga flavus]MDJ1497981.1 RNA ligase family protein [Xanthocytophaga flavus]
MFTSYEKIEEGLLNRGLTQEHYRQIQKAEWVVTEKLHGANFCVVLTAQEIQYAKRKEILLPEDDFFGYQDLVEKLEGKFLEIQDLLQKKGLLKAEETALLYGELCGGGYPHPDIEPNPLVDLVQSGIYYSPNIEFCIFDIAIQNETSDVAKKYLDYDTMASLCNQVGLIYAEALLIGSYEEALHFDIHFESRLPAKLNLPRLPFPNLAEGVVIKPRVSLVLTTPKEIFRPVLKMKIQEFSEVQFHQSEKWNAFEPKGKTTRLIRDILRLINANRVSNAVSKIGRVKASDSHKVAQLSQYFREDIQYEIETNFRKSLNKLTQMEKEMIERHIHAAMEETIKEFLREKG